MSSRPVKCAHCKSATIAETRATRTGGHHLPGERTTVTMDPDHRNVVLLVCPACNGVSTWKNKRILIVDA